MNAEPAPLQNLGDLLGNVQVRLPHEPPVAETTPCPTRQERLAQARSFLKAGQHDQARDLCRQLALDDPSDWEVLEVLSGCRFDLTDFATEGLAFVPRTFDPQAVARATEDQLKSLMETLLQRVGFRRLQKLGFHLQRADFYSPLNDCDFLEANPDLWYPMHEPAAIDWRLADQLEAAREVSGYVEELRSVPDWPSPGGTQFGWNNNFWNNADALVQYGLVRARHPRRYVEIGCGWSSLLLRDALEKNTAEGHLTEVNLVEPYPNETLFQHLPKEWQHHRVMLQRAPLELFDRLEAGDFLFYDGSHCAKVASDVNWFFFRVLPRLKPGVIIHLHDISLPQEYPPPWIFDRGQTWNEQYLLQAFLMHNPAYRILIANRYLFCHRQADLEVLYRGVQPVYGSSFWMEKASRESSHES